ncbi:molybdenum cofactor guanylyltransferase [Arthrobacter sp. UYEF3]|uniref:molybdenum cofactor guanylyltransferase n=1 Tax=Arthrobacter sp. UYEF3 TaxID=1756365 RepID=UPI003393181A
MEYDAVILAGGRSSRLGGVPKSQLTVDGATLLERSLQAARGARRTVVVGPDRGGLPPGVLGCREDPPFSGPAAAIAAGLSALAVDTAAAPTPLTLVLACDMPRVVAAVGALLDAMATGADGRDGAVAVSADGRKQPLVGLYGTAALRHAVADAARHNALEGGSVFALLASLELCTVPVPPGSTDDVDTWDDASALGVSVPGPVRGDEFDIGGKR